MTTTPVCAGYIVFDNDGMIHGTGATADEAWAAYRAKMQAAGITVLDDDEDSPEPDGRWTRGRTMRIQAASSGLIALVNARGGDCAWDSVGGVACTRYEAEGQLALFRVENVLSRVVFGEYEARDEQDALDVYARDAGYRDFADACEVAPVAEGEIVATRRGR